MLSHLDQGHLLADKVVGRHEAVSWVEVLLVIQMRGARATHSPYIFFLTRLYQIYGGFIVVSLPGFIREVTQSCPDPMDCSLPGSSVHGIFQAIVLEWIAISFSRGSSQPRDQTRVSHIVDRCFTV